MHHTRHRQYMVSEEGPPRKAKTIWILLFILIWSVVAVYVAHVLGIADSGLEVHGIGANP